MITAPHAPTLLYASFRADSTPSENPEDLGHPGRYMMSPGI